jgi:hypothetical protein
MFATHPAALHQFVVEHPHGHVMQALWGKMDQTGWVRSSVRGPSFPRAGEKPLRCERQAREDLCHQRTRLDHLVPRRFSRQAGRTQRLKHGFPTPFDRQLRTQAIAGDHSARHALPRQVRTNLPLIGALVNMSPSRHPLCLAVNSGLQRTYFLPRLNMAMSSGLPNRQFLLCC